MDAFLEDGSHEATIAVIRALVIAVPHTIDRLRDYILNLISGKMFGKVINVLTFVSHFLSFACSVGFQGLRNSVFVSLT